MTTEMPTTFPLEPTEAQLQQRDLGLAICRAIAEAVCLRDGFPSYSAGAQEAVRSLWAELPRSVLGHGELVDLLRSLRDDPEAGDVDELRRNAELDLEVLRQEDFSMIHEIAWRCAEFGGGDDAETIGGASLDLRGHLQRIEVRWRLSPWTSQGQTVLGKAKLLPKAERELGYAWWRIELNLAYWLVATPIERRALLHHEMCHLAIEVNDEGVVRPKVRGHDIEDFAATVARFGARFPKQASYVELARRHPEHFVRVRAIATAAAGGQQDLFGGSLAYSAPEAQPISAPPPSRNKKAQTTEDFINAARSALDAAVRLPDECDQAREWVTVLQVWLDNPKLNPDAHDWQRLTAIDRGIRQWSSK